MYEFVKPKFCDTVVLAFDFVCCCFCVWYGGPYVLCPVFIFLLLHSFFLFFFSLRWIKMNKPVVLHMWTLECILNLLCSLSKGYFCLNITRGTRTLQTAAIRQLIPRNSYIIAVSCSDKNSIKNPGSGSWSRWHRNRNRFVGSETSHPEEIRKNAFTTFPVINKFRTVVSIPQW